MIEANAASEIKKKLKSKFYVQHKKMLHLGFVFLLCSLCFLEWNSMLMDYQVENVQLGHAVVTFVIPSTLTRKTLHRTILSLQNQTLENWKAVIGVDIQTSQFKSQKDVDMLVKGFRDQSSEKLLLSRAQIKDPRLQFVAVDTGSPFRGERGNGAGGVRNILIQQFVKTEWVVFVDDDDTVSPFNLYHLQQAISRYHFSDVVISRMRDEESNLTLPFNYNIQNGTLWPTVVGISFAARRDMFVSQSKAVLFEPNQYEDFYFIQTAFKKRKNILLSSCTDYFVKTSPLKVFYDRPEHDCEFFPLLRILDWIPGQPIPQNLAKKREF